jgi:response regulator RpfG family c-di-GMP phosphodiesterase
MREHVTGGSASIGSSLVEGDGGDPYHHERYDGLRLDGLRGPEIPIGARIIAVVDAYVAMLSERPHRSAFSPEQALSELERQAGIQFDPEVVEVFFRVIQDRRIPLGSEAKAKILIADKDADFRELMEMRLHNEGLEVQGTGDVRDALPLMLESPLNLILAAVGGRQRLVRLPGR